jgi:transposase-like protein
LSYGVNVILLASILNAIHAQKNRKAARVKARDVVARLLEMKLQAVVKEVEDSVDKTLEYLVFPSEHWRKIRRYINTPPN